MTRILRALLCGTLVLTLANTAPATGTLTVEVGNVRAARGSVRIDICPEAHFVTDDCPWHASSPARFGSTSVTVTGVPAGRYAVQAFLDENDNTRVDRGFLGMPKEGIGFSNDARIVLSPPKFRDAAFDFDGSTRTIHLNLRYFLGDPGPQAGGRQRP